MSVDYVDLGFSLCEVLNYKFDCFSGYGYLDFSISSWGSFYHFVFQSLQLFHLCCRFYQYKVFSCISLLIFLESVPKLPVWFMILVNLYTFFFSPWNSLKYLLVFSKNQVLFSWFFSIVCPSSVYFQACLYSFFHLLCI